MTHKYIAGFGINPCQNEHIKSTPSHPAKLSYMDGKLVAKCTEEVILPPVQQTDKRYISWFVENDINDSKLLLYSCRIFSYGVHMVHQLVLLTSSDEVVYCL